MRRKRREYFAAGVEQVWIVDPNSRTVAVYTDAEEFRLYTEGESIDGGEILPGFVLRLSDVFAKLDRQAGS
jgi:Uma2 family endonuclease